MGYFDANTDACFCTVLCFVQFSFLLTFALIFVTLSSAVLSVLSLWFLGLSFALAVPPKLTDQNKSIFSFAVF